MDEIYCGGAYEPDVVAALERLTRPSFVCPDVGAHVGFFTLLLARLVGSEGRVLAFEASSENAAVVERNIEKNSLGDRVSVRTAAVSDGIEPWVMLYPGRSGGSLEWTTSLDFASREDVPPTRREPERVESVALDDVLAPGSRLDVVKMDIEGGEASALRGMRRLLDEARPVIVLEFHREVGWPGIEVLCRHGYRVEALSGQPLPFPRDASEVPYQLVARRS